MHEGVKSGISFGSALAITISWSKMALDSLGHDPRSAFLVLRDLLRPDTVRVETGKTRPAVRDPCRPWRDAAPRCTSSELRETVAMTVSGLMVGLGGHAPVVSYHRQLSFSGISAVDMPMSMPGPRYSSSSSLSPPLSFPSCGRWRSTRSRCSGADPVIAVVALPA